jgi:hypothetical protein
MMSAQLSDCGQQKNRVERKENNLFVAKIKMSLSKPGRKKQSLGPRES